MGQGTAWTGAAMIQYMESELIPTISDDQDCTFDCSVDDENVVKNENISLTTIFEILFIAFVVIIIFLCAYGYYRFQKVDRRVTLDCAATRRLSERTPLTQKLSSSHSDEFITD